MPPLLRLFPLVLRLLQDRILEAVPVDGPILMLPRRRHIVEYGIPNSSLAEPTAGYEPSLCLGRSLLNVGDILRGFLLERTVVIS